MKIKTIGYGKVVATGDYGNKKMYLEAEVNATDDPAKVLALLAKSVDKVLKSSYCPDDYIGDDEIPF